MPAVWIYGPQGSGKTENAAALAQYCGRIHPLDELADGPGQERVEWFIATRGLAALILSLSPPRNPRCATVVSIKEALTAIDRPGGHYGSSTATAR